MWAIIGTWRMALEGVDLASAILNDQGDAGDAIEVAIQQVEDFPYFKSVGYGGLPNEEEVVELDAAYMDGTSFDIGAVGAIKDFANPISIARRLAKEPVNNFLVGSGGEKYAHRQGFERKNMLSDRAKIHFHNRVKTSSKQELSPYSGHDTVGMVALDQSGRIVVGTSTSGLFMKKPGRVGDSPVIGSGLYADSLVGGATATGLGEDCMKAAISVRIVDAMSHGLSPQDACESVVRDVSKRLIDARGKVGDISVVALNNRGQWGVATNIEGFSFVVATSESRPTVYLTSVDEDYHCTHQLASQAWLDNYMATRSAPLERL